MNAASKSDRGRVAAKPWAFGNARRRRFPSNIESQLIANHNSTGARFRK